MIANFSERKTGNVLADMKFAIHLPATLMKRYINAKLLNLMKIKTASATCNSNFTTILLNLSQKNRTDTKLFKSKSDYHYQHIR